MSGPDSLTSANTLPGLPPADAIPQGTTIDRYVVLKAIGRGGMGTVYLGFDTELERRVAIKLLNADRGAEGSSGEARMRVLREAQAMAKVSHPNVVAVYDVGTYGDQVFLAMEYVHGATLREWCARQKRSSREIVAAYVQAGRGLEAAHAQGILHRDFKPENVVVDDHGRVRVLDFGLARLESRAFSGESASASRIELDDTGVQHRDALATALTNVGEIVGTPAYMAPEQLTGLTLTARSDQFSYCLALYEALYGELPFGGATVAERAGAMHAGRFRPAPHDARVPGSVRRALVRGLSGDAERRFASMGALLATLERAMTSPKWWGAAIAFAAAGIVGVAVVATRPQPPRPCRGAEAEIAPAWSPARAEEVTRAFTASGNERADETFAHVRPLLDRYAAAWVSMNTDACEATRVRGVQSGEGLDLRMACLRQRGRELQATVDLFSSADAKLVDHAVEAASQLTPLDTCVDLAALRAPFAPPKDDAQRRAVEEVRVKLARVQAMENADQRGEAYPIAASLVDEATRSGYPPVRAEALYRRGFAEYFLEKPETAATYLEAALDAERSRHDLLAAQAWLGLVDDVGVRQGKVADAAPYARIADAAIARAGENVSQRAELLELEGWMASIRGAQKEARELAEQALGLREKTLGKDDTATLRSRSDLADRLSDDGALEEALVMYREVYRARVALFGEKHPGTVRTLNDIALNEDELGNHAAALPLTEKAIALATHPGQRADARMCRAMALVGTGRTADGVAIFEEGIAILEEARGADNVYMASDRADFARSLVQRGADREAEAQAKKALDLFARIEHREQEVREATSVRALCEVRRGDATAALKDAGASLDATEKSSGATRELVPRLARGESLLLLGRPKEALADLERALAIADSTRGDLAIRADVRFAAARAIARSDRARASELATRAASELDAEGLPDAAARVRAWLGASR